MSDIDLSGALDFAFGIYIGLLLLLSAAGSFGLYKMRSANRCMSPTLVGLASFAFMAALGTFACVPFFNVLGICSFGIGPLLLFAYAIFGLTAWAFSARRF